MADDFDIVKERIRHLFDTSPKDMRRNELANLPRSLKLSQRYLSLDKVINRLGKFSDGGAYEPGDTSPSLEATNSSLPPEEKKALNKFYLSKVEQFQAWLGEA